MRRYCGSIGRTAQGTILGDEHPIVGNIEFGRVGGKDMDERPCPPLAGRAEDSCGIEARC